MIPFIALLPISATRLHTCNRRSKSGLFHVLQTQQLTNLSAHIFGTSPNSSINFLESDVQRMERGSRVYNPGMNERLLVDLRLNGKALPVQSLSRDGLVLAGDGDTWPRGLTVEFDGRSSVTKLRMDRVRHLRGWHPWQFKFDVSVDSGRLALSGVDANALPSGDYWFRLRIGDLKLPQGRISAHIPDNGDALVRVNAGDDQRRIELTGDPVDFDPEVRRILESPDSRVDGLPLIAWLRDPAKKPRRKACVLNVLAKLRTTPTLHAPLIRSVQSVFFADVDRIYVATGADFLSRLQALAADPKKPYYDEGSPKSGVHLRIKERMKDFEVDAQAFTLLSFRQEGKNSLQAVVAVPPAGPAGSGPSRTHYADLDIDLGNPLQDIQGFFIHLGELLGSGKTDHIDLHDKLAKGSTSQFLYYDVAD